MRIADSLTERLLKKAEKKITDEQIAELRKQEAKDKKPLQDLAIKNNLISEKELTKLYADEIDVPLIELNAKDIKHEILKELPERIARQYHAVLFDVDENKTIYMSARNIRGVEVSPATQLNAYAVLRPKRLLLTRAAVEELCKNAKWSKQ